ncbi:MAG: T9SS type A sorting domain-containing protein [Bacteroidia bacterium]
MWDNIYGGSAYDYPYDMTLTPDFNYLIAGQSNSPISFEKTQGSWNASGDFWVIKVDQNGIKKWDKRFGGTSDDYAYNIVVESNTTYLVVGASNSGIGGDKMQANFGYSDVWVIRIDSSGALLDQANFGTSQSEGLNAKVLPTADNGVLIICSTNAGIDGDKSVPGKGGNDFWIIKTDHTLNKLWDVDFGGSSTENVMSVVQTADHGFLIGGITQSGISGDVSQPAWGGNDYWVVRIDSMGNKLWDKRFGGNSYDNLYSVILCDDGGFLLSGNSTSNVSGNKTSPLHGGSNTDVWLVKIDALGNKLWDRSCGGNSDEDENVMASKTHDGNFVVTSTSYSNISGDKTEANTLGTEQPWVFKIDNSGTILWDKTVLTNGHHELSLAMEGENRSIIAASFNPYSTGGYCTHPPHSGGSDYWVVKFSDTTTYYYNNCFGDTTQFVFSFGASLFGAQWDFDDPASGADNFSTFFNPSHIFTAPGTYNVDVILYYMGGTDSMQIEVTIHPLPTLNLGPDTTFCSGTAFLINAGAHHSYQWQNGSTNSTFTATAAGTYFVTVEDSGCFATDSIMLNTILCNVPVINLYSSDTVFCVNNCIGFYDLSTNNPTSWNWSFPGAVPASSTVQNPTNVCYNSYGSFDVTLIACNGGGCDTLVIPGFINTIAPPTVIITQSAGTLYASPAFTYQWYSVSGLIPGATGSSFTPATVGNYYVVVTNSSGCSATSNTLTVNAVLPVVNLMSNDTSFCGYKCVDFYDLSTNSPTSWQWFFPGAVPATSTVQNPSNLCYNSYGSFDVTLISCNSVGCDTLVMPGFINASPIPTAVISLSGGVLYSSFAFSYQWYSVATGIIAGSTSSYLVPPSVGDYYVIVTSSAGCSATSNIISITALALLVNFMSNDTTFCEKRCIDFYDLSTNNPTSWQWYFPGADSTSSTLQNPANICYNNYGSFDVKLIACNAAGCDSILLVNFIQEYQAPLATITQSGDTLFSSYGVAYQWYNVAGGIIPGATNSYYIPQQAGDYYVIITDTVGCEGVSNVITITGISQLSIGNWQLAITPNPNSGSFSISINQPIRNDYSIHIIDALGRILKTRSKLISQNKIDVEVIGAAKGIYSLQIFSGDVIYTATFVIR